MGGAAASSTRPGTCSPAGSRTGAPPRCRPGTGGGGDRDAVERAPAGEGDRVGRQRAIWTDDDEAGSGLHREAVELSLGEGARRHHRLADRAEDLAAQVRSRRLRPVEQVLAAAEAQRVGLELPVAVRLRGPGTEERQKRGVERLRAREQRAQPRASGALRCPGHGGLPPGKLKPDPLCFRSREDLFEWPEPAAVTARQVLGGVCRVVMAASTLTQAEFDALALQARARFASSVQTGRWAAAVPGYLVRLYCVAVPAPTRPGPTAPRCACTRPGWRTCSWMRRTRSCAPHLRPATRSGILFPARLPFFPPRSCTKSP